MIYLLPKSNMTIARISTMNEDGKLGVSNVNLVFGGVHSFGGCRIAPSYPAMDFSVCIFSVRPGGATSSFQNHHPHGIHGTGILTYVYQSIKCRYLYASPMEHLGSSRSPPPRRVWALISLIPIRHCEFLWRLLVHQTFGRIIATENTSFHPKKGS